MDSWTFLHKAVFGKPAVGEHKHACECNAWVHVYTPVSKPASGID